MLKKAKYFLLRFTDKVRCIRYNFTYGSVGPGTRIIGKIWYSEPKNIFIGKNCKIGPYCRLETFSNSSKNKTFPKLQIGDRTSIQHAVHIYCANSVVISEGCLIASGCMITDNNHGIDPGADIYITQPLSYRTTILEKGVWLGENVCVLAGAKIGERSIIGAASVVKGEIPSFSVASGNPAVVNKKYNFETKTWDIVNNGKQ